MPARYREFTSQVQTTADWWERKDRQRLLLLDGHYLRAINHRNDSHIQEEEEKRRIDHVAVAVPVPARIPPVGRSFVDRRHSLMVISPELIST